MCFVALYREGKRRWLLSNRDEYLQRKPASPPSVHELPHGLGCWPVDGEAGGTWLGVRNDGWMLVLLNGAALPHLRKPPYRHSRGHIIPQALRQSDPVGWLYRTDWTGIEPFTLICSHPGDTRILRWNGKASDWEQKEPDPCLCWSSSTLYNDRQQAWREARLHEWLTAAPATEPGAWMDFAGEPYTQEPETGIRMQRAEGLATVSSLLVVCGEEEAELHYRDYRSARSYTLQLPVEFSQQSTLNV